MTKRSYEQDCALARSADLIGERWTLLLIRDLLVGPRRFNELQRSLKGMGSNLLAKRLKELQTSGIVEDYSSADGARRYRLTVRGRLLEPPILGLIRWGYSQASGEGGHHHDDWDLLALKAFFKADVGRGLALAVQYENDDFAGWTRIADGRMTIGLGRLEKPDLVIDGSVRDLFRGAREPQSLIARGSHGQLKDYLAAFAV